MKTFLTQTLELLDGDTYISIRFNGFLNCIYQGTVEDAFFAEDSEDDKLVVIRMNIDECDGLVLVVE